VNIVEENILQKIGKQRTDVAGVIANIGGRKMKNKKISDHYCYRCKKITRSRFSMGRKLGLHPEERLASLECAECNIVKFGGRLRKIKEDK
jgi:hypothetical protein